MKRGTFVGSIAKEEEATLPTSLRGRGGRGGEKGVNFFPPREEKS